jgi:hypothetical protein
MVLCRIRAMSHSLSRSAECCGLLEPFAYARDRADIVPVEAYKIEMGESPVK